MRNTRLRSWTLRFAVLLALGVVAAVATARQSQPFDRWWGHRYAPRPYAVCSSTHEGARLRRARSPGCIIGTG